jgi:uncharacterized protein (TIGR02117 family)
MRFAQPVRHLPAACGVPHAVTGRATAVLLLCLCVTACRTLSRPESAPTVSSGTPLMVYVVRRGWHVDVGLDARDLETPLQPLASAFADSRYLLFGFGDRRYLLKRGTGNLLLALWPGAGLVLVTSLKGPPQQAFESGDVLALPVSLRQMRQLQSFIRESLDPLDGLPRPVAPGPYADSAYYEARRSYSLLHTCNTWAAEALQAAQLPVHSAGVEFSGQLWVQARELDPRSVR